MSNEALEAKLTPSIRAKTPDELLALAQRKLGHQRKYRLGDRELSPIKTELGVIKKRASELFTLATTPATLPELKKQITQLEGQRRKLGTSPRDELQRRAIDTELSLLLEARERVQFKAWADTKPPEYLTGSLAYRTRLLKESRSKGVDETAIVREMKLIRQRQAELAQLNEAPPDQLQPLIARREEQLTRLKPEDNQARDKLELELSLLRKKAATSQNSIPPERKRTVTVSELELIDQKTGTRYPNVKPLRDYSHESQMLKWNAILRGEFDPRELPVLIDEGTYAETEIFLADDSYQEWKRVESGGINFGYIKKDPQTGREYVEAVYFLPIPRPLIEDQQSAAHLTFSPDFWSFATKVQDALQEVTGDVKLQMVGWTHSHPELSVFLSGDDRFMHQNFFTDPNHFALVIDPRLQTDMSPETGVFSRQGRGSEQGSSGIKRHKGFWLTKHPISPGRRFTMRQVMDMQAIRDAYRSIQVEPAARIRWGVAPAAGQTHDTADSRIRLGEMTGGTTYSERQVTRSLEALTRFTRYLIDVNPTLKQMLGGSRGAQIIPFEGVPIQQRQVDNLETCVLASLQMLMTHAGWIAGQWANRFDLVHQKGEILDLAGRVSSKLRDSTGWATLNIGDIDGMNKLLVRLQTATGRYRPVNQPAGTVETQRNVDLAYQTPDIAEYLGIPESVTHEYMPGTYILADILNRLLHHERSSFMVRLTSGWTEAERAHGGHEVVIAGVAVLGDARQPQVVFRVLDPLSGGRWMPLKDLVYQIEGGYTVATPEGVEQARPVTAKEISHNRRVSAEFGSRIVW